MARTKITPIQMYNPIKFSVYRAGAHTSSTSSQKVAFDTKTFDTGNNVDIVTNVGRFTAPVAGFYHFDACTGNTAAASTIMYIALFKNGASTVQGNVVNPTVGNNRETVSGLIQLAVNDYVEVFFVGGGGSVMAIGADNTYFHGFLVSTT